MGFDRIMRFLSEFAPFEVTLSQHIANFSIPNLAVNPLTLAANWVIRSTAPQIPVLPELFLVISIFLVKTTVFRR